MGVIVRCATYLYADGFRYAVCGAGTEPVLVDDVTQILGPYTFDEYTTRLAELRTYVWGSSALPTTLPTYAAGVVEARLASVGADAIDLLTFSGPFAVTQYAWRMRHVTTPATSVCLYNGGHGATGFDAATLEILADLYAGGVDVVVMTMPFDGDSSDGLYVATPLNDHDDLAIPEADHSTLGYSALRLFFDPIVQTLNQIASGYTRIAMAGKSGGGWTATVAAALDRRITHCFDVNGSLPQFLRSAISMGDWEQNCPSAFYEIASYEHLYVMSAIGGRTAVQILGERDSTFPNGRECLDVYRIHIERRLALVDSTASWSGLLDPTAGDGWHAFSKAATRTVLEHLT